MLIRYPVLFLLLGTVSFGVFSQTPKSKPKQATSKATTPAKPKPAATGQPNLAKEPTLYVVGYAHLDTEWRWEYPQVIQEYLTKTMRNNFALFEKYPHYIFN